MKPILQILTLNAIAMLVLTTLIAVEVALCQRHELRACFSPELLNVEGIIYQ